MRDSWKRDAEGNFDFNHLFPLIFDPAGGEFLVADLSRLITAGPGEKGKRILLNAKTHEMAEETRTSLQWKLAALFGRGPE